MVSWEALSNAFGVTIFTSPLGSTCCEHAALDSMAEPSCRAVLPGRPGQRHCGVGQATGRTPASAECVVDQKPAAKLVLQMERSRWALQQPEDCLASALLPDAFQDAPGVPLAQAPSITNCLRCCREDACWSQHCQARPRPPLHLRLAYLWHLAGIPILGHRAILCVKRRLSAARPGTVVAVRAWLDLPAFPFTFPFFPHTHALSLWKSHGQSALGQSISVRSSGCLPGNLH